MNLYWELLEDVVSRALTNIVKNTQQCDEDYLTFLQDASPLHLWFSSLSVFR